MRNIFRNSVCSNYVTRAGKYLMNSRSSVEAETIETNNTSISANQAVDQCPQICPGSLHLLTAAVV
jgi:hypothetical protein